MGTVSAIFFRNELFGIIILIAHYLSNVILALVVRKWNTISNINYTLIENKSQNFPVIFIKSIKNAIDTLLTILGTLTCFLVLSAIIIYSLDMNVYSSAIFKGILEITMGLKDLSLLVIPDIYKVVIATMIISFGGLSVHMQVLSFLIDTEISYMPFLVSRIFHAIISGFISYIIYVLII